MLLRYLPYLGLTIAIELPLALLVLRRLPRWRVALAALAGNLVTHPLLHFALPRVLDPADRGRFILIGEVAVFVVETLLYLAIARPRPRRLAIAASAIANAGSYAFGLLLS
jgi:hypothetical protein